MGRRALLLTAISAGLHFLWENAQCSLFFVHGSFATGLRGMVIATTGDVAITWSIFLLIAVVSGGLGWASKRWRGWQWGAILLLALAVAIGIERRALTTGRWSYTAIAPTLPGLEVGLVPLAPFS